jgi:hypothetical protein
MNGNALASLAKQADILPVFIILLIFILSVPSYCFVLHFFVLLVLQLKNAGRILIQECRLCSLFLSYCLYISALYFRIANIY